MPEQFRVVALAAGANLEELAGQIARHRPRAGLRRRRREAAELRERLRAAANGAGLPEIQHGQGRTAGVATHPEAEMVVSAAVGVVGLEATYAACARGSRWRFRTRKFWSPPANWSWPRRKARASSCCPSIASTTPSTSACAPAAHSEVRRLILTASGGPFARRRWRRWPRPRPEQALAHPNWRMGQRISIDSATLVNKGFEVIEARWLFDMRAGADRRRDSSAVHDSLHGGVCGWFHFGATRPNGHAHAHPICANLSGAGGIQWGGADWDALRRLDFEKVSPRSFPACGWLARRWRRAARSPVR